MIGHAMVIALAMGAAFSTTLLGGGEASYRMMGARGGALTAALAYSRVIFAGAAVVWLFNSLAAVVRGSGNMVLPAAVTLGGGGLLATLSACLRLRLGARHDGRH